MRLLPVSILVLFITLPINSIYGVTIPQKLKELEQRREQLVKQNDALYEKIKKVRKQIDALEGDFSKSQQKKSLKKQYDGIYNQISAYL